MSPRPYQLGKRQVHIDEGRRRVLDAARSLLRDATSYTAFTVDAVARKADVARATVYYQFGSKTGLLEALCDDLADAGHMADLAHAFTAADPADGLAPFVTGFARLWAADRLAIRRLRALAALDPDVGAVIAARDQRRLDGLRVLLTRLAPDSDALDPGSSGHTEQTARLLHTLTSFETFDTLAGADRDPTDVAPVVLGLARAALATAYSPPSCTPPPHPAPTPTQPAARPHASDA
jgi:AcrR family transcriptional regulator